MSDMFVRLGFPGLTEPKIMRFFYMSEGCTTPSHTGSDPVEIVSFRSDLREAFERLNLAWLRAFDLLEEEDLPYLLNPEERIIASGGEVFFAVDRDGTVAGTCAAIRHNAETFELAKLAVSSEYRRQGIGRRLSETAIAFAHRAGASQVVLTSNNLLKEAIALYESLGFCHAPMPSHIRYQTANVYMVLKLRGVA